VMRQSLRSVSLGALFLIRIGDLKGQVPDLVTLHKRRNREARRRSEVKPEFCEQDRIVVHASAPQQVDEVLLAGLAEGKAVEGEVVLEPQQSFVVDAEEVGKTTRSICADPGKIQCGGSSSCPPLATSYAATQGSG
jgi:hypothetical protein